MTALSVTDRDVTTRPQDDLFRHINGVWLREHDIPADRARDGVFRALFDRAEEDVKEIILHAGEVSPSDPDAAEAQKIAAVYASFMNTARINELGAAALGPDLDLLARVTTREELAAAMGALQRVGISSAVGLYVNNDAGNPTEYRVYFTQSGLGLPDEAYYREETHAKVLEEYTGHVGRMPTLAGIVGPDAAAGAAAQSLRIPAVVRRKRPSAM